MAAGEGFEPSVVLPTQSFQDCTIGRSDIPLCSCSSVGATQPVLFGYDVSISKLFLPGKAFVRIFKKILYFPLERSPHRRAIP